MRTFVNAVFVLILCGGLFAAAPLAVDDACLAMADMMITYYPLANDLDTDELDVLSIDSFDSVSAQGGAITNLGGGALRYSPLAGFVGYDEFSYTVTDGNGGYDTANVQIDVNASYDAESARDQILSGVSVLGDPGGASGCVAYGQIYY